MSRAADTPTHPLPAADRSMGQGRVTDTSLSTAAVPAAAVPAQVSRPSRPPSASAAVTKRWTEVTRSCAPSPRRSRREQRAGEEGGHPKWFHVTDGSGVWERPGSTPQRPLPYIQTRSSNTNRNI